MSVLSFIALAPMRKAVRKTALQVLEFDHDPHDFSGEPIGLVLGGHTYPLASAATGNAVGYRQRTELALDTAIPIPAAAWSSNGVIGVVAVVAVVVLEASLVEFVKVVRSSTDRRIVDGVTVFLASD